MKKMLAVLAVCFAMFGNCYAESLSIGEQIKKIPGLKQGVAYSLAEHNFSYLSTIEVLKWKGISAEVGYSSKDKLVGVVSYELLKLKDLGVTVPILDLVSFQPGVFFGAGRLNKYIDNSETDYGISATIISIHW